MKRLDACKDQDCKISKLKTFKNFPHPKVFPKILEVLKTADAKEKKIGLAALKSLQNFPKATLKKAKPVLTTIFEDGKQDSSIRTISFEILLKLKPSSKAFERFLQVLAEADQEFTAYCLNRIFEGSSDDYTLKHLVR
jgi:hypothetical protein